MTIPKAVCVFFFLGGGVYRYNYKRKDVHNYCNIRCEILSLVTHCLKADALFINILTGRKSMESGRGGGGGGVTSIYNYKLKDIAGPTYDLPPIGEC